MDPASALIGLVSGAAALIALTGQVVSYLIDVRDDNKNTEVILLDLVLTCRAYESAWTRIRTWLLESCDARTDESEPIFQELQNFLEGGQVMMGLIKADVDRLSSKSRRGSWWREARPIGRDAARILLHKNTVLEHRDRIHCQNTSLHLLLSCSRLPSKPLQQAAVEVLRPKFRKDEETAWTIVNSRLSPRSSKAWPTTLASSRMSTVDSIASVISYRNLANKNFTFEEDLFLGPVYKRMLISRLCENPVGRSRSKSNSYNPLDASPTLPDSGRRGQPEAALHNDDSLALELRQQGVFSRSCYEDYCEFMGLHRPRKMQRRHLPLASALCQHEHKVDEQKYINDQFFIAISARNLVDIANTLDDGADINVRREGKTALELCIESWAESKAETPNEPSVDTTVAEFLMLYKETHIPYAFNQRLTILHLCMHVGATAEFMRPFLEVEGKTDALGRLDVYGRSVLHTAVLCSSTGSYAILQMSRLFGDVVVQPEYILDSQGISASSFASSQKSWDHVTALQTLSGSSSEDLSSRNAGREEENTSAATQAIEISTPEPVNSYDQLPLLSFVNERRVSGLDKEHCALRSAGDAIVLPDVPFLNYSGGQAESAPPLSYLHRRWSISLAEEINNMDPMYHFPRTASISRLLPTRGRARAASDQLPTPVFAASTKSSVDGPSRPTSEIYPLDSRADDSSQSSVLVPMEPDRTYQDGDYRQTTLFVMNPDDENS